MVVVPVTASPIFMDFILPFVLVFTLVFAILQKTKLLGDSTKQINAIIGLVVGLILIAFPFSRDVIVELMPFLAISLVVILVFMLGYGFIVGKKDGDVLHKGVKIALLIIFGLALITVFLFITDWWDTVYDTLFERDDIGQILVNVVLIVIISAAVLAVVLSKEKGGGKT
jgi:hypothetical protein